MVEKASEQKEQLQALLDKYRGTKGSVIPVLQQAQEIYGYLPKEVLIEISNQLEVPISQIYGVVTFYAQFHLEPRGRNIIRSCQGTACHVRGAKAVLKAVQEKLGDGMSRLLRAPGELPHQGGSADSWRRMERAGQEQFCRSGAVSVSGSRHGGV